MKTTLFAAAVAAGCFATAPASAAIVFFTNPGAVNPAENVLADTSMTGILVKGSTNQTDTLVSFRSLNGETLTTTASNGQARFAASDGTLDTAEFFLTDGGDFGEAEFNLFFAERDTDSVTITVNGDVSQTFDIGNGANWFGIRATEGMTISSIAFDSDGSGVRDLRQVRLGGFAGPTAPIPEPATWAMMIGGFGLIGAAMRRRDRMVLHYA